MPMSLSPKVKFGDDKTHVSHKLRTIKLRLCSLDCKDPYSLSAPTALLQPWLVITQQTQPKTAHTTVCLLIKLKPGDTQSGFDSAEGTV